MSTATKEWTAEFTCTDCKRKVDANTASITMGAFEYDDATCSHTSRSPYAHCPHCGAPHKMSADQVPASVLRQVERSTR